MELGVVSPPSLLFPFSETSGNNIYRRRSTVGAIGIFEEVCNFTPTRAALGCRNLGMKEVRRKRIVAFARG